MNPKFIDVMVSRKTSFRSCFKLETRSTILLYDHTMHAFDHFSIYATKRERKLLMTEKQNGNLNQQNLSFLISKPLKEKLQQKQLFELFYFFAKKKKQK